MTPYDFAVLKHTGSRDLLLMCLSPQGEKWLLKNCRGRFWEIGNSENPMFTAVFKSETELDGARAAVAAAGLTCRSGIGALPNDSAVQFDEGWFAHDVGESVSSNPYPEGSEPFRNWATGFVEAAADDECPACQRTCI